MITVGTDILEIERMEKSLKNPRFLTRVFSHAEIEWLREKNFPAQSAAGNYCAKEAFSKALGTGVRGFSLSEVSVLRDECGKPYLLLEGGAREKAAGRSFSVSISHCRRYATAVVVMEEDRNAHAAG